MYPGLKYVFPTIFLKDIEKLFLYLLQNINNSISQNQHNNNK